MKKLVSVELIEESKKLELMYEDGSYEYKKLDDKLYEELEERFNV